MAGATSFGSGFARGIANAMAMNRQRSDRERERRQEFQIKAALGALERGEVESSDIPMMLDFIMGQQAKGKKADPNRQVVSDILGQALRSTPPATGAMPHGGAAVSPADVLQGASPIRPPAHIIPRDASGLPTGPLPASVLAGEAPEPSSAIKAALTGVAGDQMTSPEPTPPRTMFGVPARSREEVLMRNADLEVRAREALVRRQIALARDTILPTLRSIDPKATLRDALVASGVDVDRLPASTIRPQSIAGELPDGTPAFGVFTAGQYVDPETGRPIEGFRPRSVASTRTLGTYAERAAGELGFRTATEANAAGKGAELNAKVRELMQADAKARGLGSGEAAVETEGKKLLTPDEAAKLQSDYGITRDQAAQLGRVPLTAPQVQAATESYLLDKDAARAKALFEQVWPRDTNPVTRRGKLIALQTTQNPNFVELMSILKRMPLRLAVMTQGSRPSDTDREAFDAAFPTTTATDWNLVIPTSYASGRQLLTAAENLARTSRESIGIVPLEERGRGRTTTAPRGTPPPAGGGTGLKMDAQGNILDANGAVVIQVAPQ